MRHTTAATGMHPAVSSSSKAASKAAVKQQVQQLQACMQQCQTHRMPACSCCTACSSVRHTACLPVAAVQHAAVSDTPHPLLHACLLLLYLLLYCCLTCCFTAALLAALLAAVLAALLLLDLMLYCCLPCDSIRKPVSDCALAACLLLLYLLLYCCFTAALLAAINQYARQRQTRPGNSKCA